MVGSSVRKVRNRGIDQRTRVRDEAARVFAERGYHASSLQEVADAIGFTKASIYYYYDTKEELLFDILTYADETVLALFAAEDARDDDPLTRVRRLIAAFVTWHLAHPNIAKVVFRDWSALTGKALNIQIERRRYYGHVMKDSIERCRKAGLIPRNANVGLISNFINGAVATANVWYAPSGAETPETIGREFGELAVATLAGLKTTKTKKKTTTATQKLST